MLIALEDILLRSLFSEIHVAVSREINHTLSCVLYVCYLGDLQAHWLNLWKRILVLLVHTEDKGEAQKRAGDTGGIRFFLLSTPVCFHNPFVQLAAGGLCPTDKAWLWERDVTTYSSALLGTHTSGEWIWLFQELVFQGGQTEVAFSWDAAIYKQ